MTRLHRRQQRMLAQVAEMRESAYRCADRDPQRAEMLRDQAAELLADANALRDALGDAAGRVDDPRQMEARV